MFLDLGDGQPGANGAQNQVLGDLNTDPYRFASFDPSAQRWAEFVGEERTFGWTSEVGPDAPGSYGGVADIDHLASEALRGDCWYGGLDGRPSAYERVLYDHRPVVCAVSPVSPVSARH